LIARHRRPIDRALILAASDSRRDAETARRPVVIADDRLRAFAQPVCSVPDATPRKPPPSPATLVTPI